MTESIIAATGVVQFAINDGLLAQSPDVFIDGPKVWARPVVAIISTPSETMPGLISREPLIVSEFGAIETPSEYSENNFKGLAAYVYSVNIDCPICDGPRVKSQLG